MKQEKAFRLSDSQQAKALTAAGRWKKGEMCIAGKAFPALVFCYDVDTLSLT
jgi:hypothetical protein